MYGDELRRSASLRCSNKSVKIIWSAGESRLEREDGASITALLTVSNQSWAR